METRKNTQHEILYGCRVKINLKQICSYFRDSASMCDVLTGRPFIVGKCIVTKIAFFVKASLYNDSTEIQHLHVLIISSRESIMIEAS